jgi:hypothetical protein
MEKFRMRNSLTWSIGILSIPPFHASYHMTQWLSETLATLLQQMGKNPNGANQVAVENLAVLNRASEEGLWDGRVKLFETGMPSVNTPRDTARLPWDLWLSCRLFPGCYGANIFVGTAVSTFSTDLIAARFYRGNKANYHYLLARGADAISDRA